MKKKFFFQIKKLSFSEFPYIFQENLYKKLLYNFYEAKKEITFLDKGKKKEIIILKTEIGNLKFLKNDLIEIDYKKYKNLKNSSKWGKTLMLSEKININTFPYENISFFYIEIIEKNVPLKVLKKEVINNIEYIMVKPISKYSEEEFIVKPEDLLIKKTTTTNT